ncbi:MAG: hypothetical protein K2L89_04765, partial [Muribaculaceae bacterium]|nr:hypothetical protein [Muribaculaceae bacterium]
SYIQGEGEDSWESFFPSIEINPDFMKRAGFTGRRGRFIRENVIVFTEPENEDEDNLGDTIYFEFSTEAAAKSFMKTCDEIEGLTHDDPDNIYFSSAGPSAAICREGKTVVISVDYT